MSKVVIKKIIYFDQVIDETANYTDEIEMKLYDDGDLFLKDYSTRYGCTRTFHIPRDGVEELLKALNKNNG